MLSSTEPRPPKLLDQVRDAIRVRHYSYRTEESYVYWIRRYILFHNKKHPREMESPEINAFLTHLAVVDQVAASTQNQALSALLFLYRQVLLEPLGEIAAVRAKQPQTLPTVLTQAEQASPNESVATRFATALQRIYLRMATIFAPFKNCWDTKMLKRR